MLGEQQWQWLEGQLKEYKGRIVLLASTTQFLIDYKIINERWFQKSKDRLYRLMTQYDKKMVIISGDIHYAEMSELRCKRMVGHHLIEATSSGMTHYYHK